MRFIRKRVRPNGSLIYAIYTHYRREEEKGHWSLHSEERTDTDRDPIYIYIGWQKNSHWQASDLYTLPMGRDRPRRPWSIYVIRGRDRYRQGPDLWTLSAGGVDPRHGPDLCMLFGRGIDIDRALNYEHYLWEGETQTGPWSMNIIWGRERHRQGHDQHTWSGKDGQDSPQYSVSTDGHFCRNS